MGRNHRPRPLVAPCKIGRPMKRTQRHPALLRRATSGRGFRVPQVPSSGPIWRAAGGNRASDGTRKRRGVEEPAATVLRATGGRWVRSRAEVPGGAGAGPANGSQLPRSSWPSSPGRRRLRPRHPPSQDRRQPVCRPRQERNRLGHDRAVSASRAARFPLAHEAKTVPDLGEAGVRLQTPATRP